MQKRDFSLTSFQVYLLRLIIFCFGKMQDDADWSTLGVKEVFCLYHALSLWKYFWSECSVAI